MRSIIKMFSGTGLKGYLTNTMLTDAQVIGNYSNWHIERAFNGS